MDCILNSLLLLVLRPFGQQPGSPRCPWRELQAHTLLRWLDRSLYLNPCLSTPIWHFSSCGQAGVLTSRDILSLCRVCGVTFLPLFLHINLTLIYLVYRGVDYQSLTPIASPFHHFCRMARTLRPSLFLIGSSPIWEKLPSGYHNYPLKGLNLRYMCCS